MAKDLFQQELKKGDYILFPKMGGEVSEYTGAYINDFLDGYIVEIEDLPSGNAFITVEYHIMSLHERLEDPIDKRNNIKYREKIYNFMCINVNEKRNLIPAMFI